MPGKVFQKESIHKPEIMQLLQSGVAVEDLAKQFPVSERTIWRYASDLKKLRERGVIKEKADGSFEIPSKPREVKGKAELAAVAAKSPAPIVFRIGDQNIDLNPLDLLDSWRYCEDIKRMVPNIDDNFSSMLKLAAKRMWETVSESEARKMGLDIEQVKEEAKV